MNTLQDLHTLLDDLGVPRIHNGELSVAARCEYLRAAHQKLQTECDTLRQDVVQFRTLWDESVDAHYQTQQILEALEASHSGVIARTRAASAILNLSPAQV